MILRSLKQHLISATMAAASLSGLVGSAYAQPVGSANEVPWAALTVQQQTALEPLKRQWSTIDGARQRKWLDVSARFTSLSRDEQERVQLRMSEWARMTPDQRSRARLNYQELRQVAPGERQTRWEAYRSLPEERRSELARQAQAVPVQPNRTRTDEAKSAVVTAPSTASVSRPQTPTVIQARPGATTSLISQSPSPPTHQQTGLPKMTAKPGFVDPQTLLPRRGVQGAAVAASRTDKPDTAKP